MFPPLALLLLASPAQPAAARLRSGSVDPRSWRSPAFTRSIPTRSPTCWTATPTSRHRAKPAGVRSTQRRSHCRGEDPQYRWNDWRDGSALRRRPLAGDVCRVSRNGPWSPARRREAV